MRYPNIIDLFNLPFYQDNLTEIQGTWVPARPLGYPSFWNRFKLAWLVFTGKADALIWPSNQ